MKKFKFKDGQVITAGSVEEAKAKHKVVADNKNWKLSKDSQNILIKNGFDINYEKDGAYVTCGKETFVHINKYLFSDLYTISIETSDSPFEKFLFSLNNTYTKNKYNLQDAIKKAKELSSAIDGIFNKNKAFYDKIHDELKSIKDKFGLEKILR